MVKSALVKERLVKQRNPIINTVQSQRHIEDKVDSMKDTFAKREYKCKCGRITEDYVWQSLLEFHKVACFKCGKELSIESLKVKEKTQLPSIRTDTKNR
jgi:hypothetical protein